MFIICSLLTRVFVIPSNAMDYIDEVEENCVRSSV